MVKLKTQSLNTDDWYINANWVVNPANPTVKDFIATQGPIPQSVGNFWKMIWQEMVSAIVMLCGLEEDGRVSCHVYWPESKNHTFKVGNLVVSAGTIDKSNEFYWIREIHITVNRRLNTSTSLPTRRGLFSNIT